jgi:Na+/H+ antiporter NhaD/arsenite permease-like protein
MDKKWPELKFLDFSPMVLGIIVFSFAFLNFILFLLFRKKDIRNKKQHRLIATINILIELFIAITILYKGHVLFIIFAPIIILFHSLLGHGITTELSDQDKAGIKVFREEQWHTHMRARYMDFFYFSGYYFVESWKKIL